MGSKTKKPECPANPQIGLDAAQSQEACSKINEFASKLLFLRQLLESGACPETSVATHLGLARHDYEDLAHILGQDAYLNSQLEETAAMLRDANRQLRDLKRSMGESASPEQAIAGWKSVCDAFDSWFSLKGFDYAKCEYGPWGISADFSEETHLDRDPEYRVSDYHGSRPLKYAAVDFVAALDAEDFDARLDGHRTELLDTDRTRAYIRSLFASELPGARVTKFKSFADRDDYLLRFEAHVPYEAVIAWKRSVLKQALAAGKARTGKLYLDLMDMESKLSSKDWVKYSAQKDVDAMKSEREKTAKLISTYEYLSSKRPMEELQAWLAENGLDAPSDFEGSLYDGYA